MEVVVTEGWYDPDGHMNDDWFEPSIYKNPLDSMPIATDKGAYSSRHEYTPDNERAAEEVVTMHERMYRMATKNGTHTLGGGSENLNSR